MKIILLASLIFSAAANACPQYEEKWVDCKSDTDCMVDFSACYSLLALNKAFLKDNAAHNTCVRPMIKCARGDTEQDRLAARALCKSGKCAVERGVGKK